MSDDIWPRPPTPVPGRPFQKGHSGNPAGRRRGSRNKATLAAAALLDGESEGLTRKAVELALEGDRVALRLCFDRILPRRVERTVAFRLPAAITGSAVTGGPTPGDICRAMNAVTAAIADGEITPGEAATIAGVFESFVRTIEVTGTERFCVNQLPFATDEEECEEDGDGGAQDGGDAYDLP